MVGEAATLRDESEPRSLERDPLSFERERGREEPRSHISGEERDGFSAMRSAGVETIGTPPIEPWSP